VLAVSAHSEHAGTHQCASRVLVQLSNVCTIGSSVHHRLVAMTSEQPLSEHVVLEVIRQTFARVVSHICVEWTVNVCAH
jgi:hypothetical protein